MPIFKKHPRLILLAVLMPLPMILSADIKGFAGHALFMGSFFAVMVPMLVVRMKGELTVSEFMTIGGLMMVSWTLLVFVRAIIFGLLGREL